MRIRFADGSTYDQIGVINFVDVIGRPHHRHRHRARHHPQSEGRADRRTVRARRAARAASRRKSVVVPQAALIADQQGVYVFVVEDGKAAVKRLKTGGETRNRRRWSRTGSTAASWSSSTACRGCGPGIAVRASPAAARRGPEIDRCSPRSSSTGRASPSSSRSSPRSRACSRCCAIPVAQYPDIVPPQVSVTTTLSRRVGGGGRRDHRAADRGAGRRRRQDDLHEERQRRRRQLHAARCSFELGTDPDINTVNVNNRVQVALVASCRRTCSARASRSRRSPRRCSA